MRLRGKKWGRKSVRSSSPQSSRPRESCAEFKRRGGLRSSTCARSTLVADCRSTFSRRPQLLLAFPDRLNESLSAKLVTNPAWLSGFRINLKNTRGKTRSLPARTTSADYFDSLSHLRRENPRNASANCSRAGAPKCSDPNGKNSRVDCPGESWLTLPYDA